ncbi:MAG: beta-ketoacyl-ACP synthase II [Chloroflexota bacterium]|nr:beta-ketoacyl-ACP synthase II [Chloroflexota bacterium]MDE2931606.1 beta-ketoacyl-ACP synthase II [Chloroflexota bacterium]
MSRSRIVVTGMGAVTPVGNCVADSWRAVCAGTPGITRISRFDTDGFAAQIAGEVKNFDPRQYVDAREVRRMDRFTQYAVAAGQQAMDDSGLDINGHNTDRIGVFVGSGIGGIESLESQFAVMAARGPSRLSPFLIPMLLTDTAAGAISIRFGLRGPNLAVVSACATGAHAVGEGAAAIRRGDADVMICGSSEAAVTPMTIAGFAAMRALSTRNDAPAAASRPFEKQRDGFVVGEGAGVLVLESLEHALDRGARIYGEVAGYGATADASHITAPPEDGEGAARAMQSALEQAQLQPQDVQYINAHGTSTPLNDRAETQAIKAVFGAHAGALAVSSTKSMTGHLLGGAGGVESVFCLKAIGENIIPPTINYAVPDPDCDLDYVPNTARSTAVHAAMNNSFGFGGHNASLVFTRYET